MRVLLIIPTHNYQFEYPTFLSNVDFPVGFAYLASALRNAGHEVFGLNPNNAPNYTSAYEMIYDKIRRLLEETQPELIGLGGLSSNFKFLKDAIQIIRRLAPDVPVVCGGGIITYDAEFVFKTLHPDFCIIGEGEEALVQLANMLESKRQDYEEISNLGYWKNNIAKFTKQDFNYIDIDKRNFPDYEPFGIDEMLDNYSLAARYVYRYTRPKPRPMTIVTARGCPFNCTFCVHQRGPKYRARSVENIIQELAFLYERYRFNILIILDELFAANKPRLKEFCAALNNARKRRGWDFDWLFQTHLSISLDRKTFEIVKQAGCYCVSYGVESASPKVLASMNKKINPQQILEAIKIAHDIKTGLYANFIFGDIAETTQTILETMRFFLDHCLNDHIQLIRIRPHPGSKLFDHCLEKGIITNRPEFYKHTDRVIYNMTSIPDILWLPWIEKVESLSKSSPWSKSATLLRYAKESESADNPLAIQTDKLIWDIWVGCPYCNKEVYCRELLDNAAINQEENKEEQINSGFAKNLFSRIIEEYRKERLNFVFKLSKRIIKKIIFYFVRFSPLFKMLVYIMPRHEIARASFLTGCPYCHKRIRVDITKKDLKKELT